MNREAVLQCIRTRRSIRTFASRQVEKEALEAVLEAGTWAPTGQGKQSPVIIAVQDPKTRAQLVRMNAEVMGRDSDPYYGAPTLILVLADPAVTTWIEDGSCVLNTMLLAAHAVGLGGVWIHRERQMFDGEEGKALLKTWGLDPTLRGVGAIALGYPQTEAPQPKPRKENYIIRI